MITGLGPDFTRMESFGKVDEFADTLVWFLFDYLFSIFNFYSFFWGGELNVKVFNVHQLQVSGLDRSWQRPRGVAAKLIDCKAANGNAFSFFFLSQSLLVLLAHSILN